MTNRTVFRSQRTWFIVIVDEVRHGAELTAIGRTVNPVVDYIIDVVKHTAPADRWVATCIVGPKVAHKGRVLTTDGRSKGMIPCIKCLGGNGILDSHIDCRLLAVGFAVMHVEHMTIERDIFVQSPLARTMVNHNVSHRIATKGVLAVGNQRLATTETHVTHNDVVGIDLERLSGNADTVARSGLSSYGDIRCTNVDG